jgi:signal transduction histidine kinase/HPt (histidine-containing phosphotransfer) domain-containing protein/ActR/RegA family two-component response regulator/HAMP domain-containing protein
MKPLQRRLADLPLAIKMMAVPAIFSASLLLVVWAGLSQGNTARDAARAIDQHTLPQVARVYQVSDALADIQVDLSRLAARRQANDDANTIAELHRDVREECAAARARLIASGTAADDPALRQAMLRYIEDAERVSDGIVSPANGGAPPAESLAQDFLDIRGRLKSQILAVESRAHGHTDAALAEVDHSRRVILALVLAVLTLTLGLSLLILRGISRPIVGMTLTMGRLAQGHTGMAVPGLGRADEIGSMASAVEVFRQTALDLAAVHTRLQSAEARLSTAIQAMPSGFASFDSHGRVEIHNTPFVTLLECKGELGGKPWQQLLTDIACSHAYDGQWLDRLVLWFEAQGRLGALDIRVGQRVLRLAADRMRGGGTVVIATDISEREAAEEALRAAMNQAEEAARAKAEFLAVMSHEIRTPMNGILGMAQLALEHAEDPRQRDYLETVAESGEALLTVLNDILDFSKLEANGVHLERARFDLARVVESVTTLLSSHMREKGLDIQVAVDAALPRWFIGDAARLRQVLLNLVGNAIKFTDKGGVTITVAADTLGQGEALLRFVIADTGIGIPAAARQRLFAPFSQADSSINRRFGGTGLGLAICRKLVELQGGNIGVDSEPGQGSRFWFTLPLAAAWEQADDEDSDREHLPQREPMTILLAEDTEVNRKVAFAMLVKQNHRVTCVANGAEAVEACRDHRFDLIFMDLHMPRMNGLEASRAIRAGDGKSAQVPIVALTAAALPEDARACREAGMDGFLAKPFREEQLLAALTVHRGVHQPAPSPSKSAGPKSQAAHFDRDTFDGMVTMLGPGVVREAAEDFHRLVPELVGELEAAVSGGDMGAAAEAAHSLKGAAAQIGLANVAEFCRQLEIAAKAVDAGRVIALAASLPATITDGEALLEQEIAALP